MATSRRTSTTKLSPAQRAKRARAKVVRAALRETVKDSSLLKGPVPTDDAPRLRPSSGDRRVPSALTRQVLDSLAHQVHFARRHWGKPFRMPSVSFDLRGTTAGTADGLNWHIQLNPVLLVENPQEMATQTSGHELAHLLTASLYGGAATAHGPHWRAVMRALGLSPDRTHDMDVMNAMVGQELYKYRCGCQLWPVKPKLHAGLRTGARTAKCPQCEESIEYTGEVRLKGTWYKDPVTAKPRPGPAATRTAETPAQSRLSRGGAAGSAPAPRAPAARPSAAQAIAPAPRHPQAAAPSPAALRFAWDLARRLHVGLTPQQTSDAAALSAFIAHAQKLIATGAAGMPSREGDEPSDRQLAFAAAIAARRGLSVPRYILASRRLLSTWIDANKG